MNPCGAGKVSPTFSFETADEPCESAGFEIPDDDTNGVDSSNVISTTGTLLDLGVRLLATHPYVGDLTVTLVHEDSGTAVTLMDRPGFPLFPFGCEGNDIDVVFRDSALVPVEELCDSSSPAIRGSAIPHEPLQAFAGEDLSGTWTLNVSDNSAQDVGSLVEWCLIPTMGVPAGIDCPPILEMPNVQGMCGADVYLPISADGVPAPTVEYFHQGSLISNPEFLPVGAHTIEVLAANSLGSATCAVTVEVVDIEPPNAICIDTTVELDAMGTAIVLPASVDGGSTDNCQIVTSALSQIQFTCEDLGSSTLVLYVSDSSGLVGICSASVTVVDSMPPKVEVPILNPILGNEFGQAAVPDLIQLSAFSDNCSSTEELVISQNPIAGTLVGVGTSEITLSARDVSGNIESVAAIVTVLEHPTPTETPTSVQTPVDTPTVVETETSCSTPNPDVNCDGEVDALDMLEFVRQWKRPG